MKSRPRIDAKQARTRAACVRTCTCTITAPTCPVLWRTGAPIIICYPLPEVRIAKPCPSTSSESNFSFLKWSFSVCCSRERARWTLSRLAVLTRTHLPKGLFMLLWPRNNLRQNLRRASKHVDGSSSVSGPSPACSACLFGTPRPLFPALHCPWSRWMRGPQVRYASPLSLYRVIFTEQSKDM
jgi:hypothetical protein